MYWIKRYYDSIYFLLSKDEVVVERGVWWRMRHTVPYSRIMSVDVIQGPILRLFSLGSVHIHTAGYTGPAGGSAGPGTRGAEAVIWGAQNFNEVREAVLSMVRGRPLFATAAAPDTSREILEELRSIRKILEKESDWSRTNPQSIA
ncbi:MAG: PH domain-containing protein [Candidatus Bathyarchaeia archaeon]